MTIRKRIIGLAALLLPLLVAAQPTGGITGTVIDRGSRAPVQGRDAFRFCRIFSRSARIPETQRFSKEAMTSARSRAD